MDLVTASPEVAVLGINVVTSEVVIGETMPTMGVSDDGVVELEGTPLDDDVATVEEENISVIDVIDVIDVTT